MAGRRSVRRLGYQIGYLANLLPIPGGVGVLEGGLPGALLLYGLPAGPTAAAVVIYHAGLSDRH